MSESAYHQLVIVDPFVYERCSLLYAMNMMRMHALLFVLSNTKILRSTFNGNLEITRHTSSDIAVPSDAMHYWYRECFEGHYISHHFMWEMDVVDSPAV